MNNLLIAFVAMTLGTTAARAQEVLNYQYDARGRLTQVGRAGSVNAGIATSYGIDRADNRSATSTSGSSNAAEASDVSFESPEVGAGFAYTPSGSGTTFTLAAGIAGNGSGWNFASAPHGDQVAFLQRPPQGISKISMTVSGLVAGATYAVQLQAAQRPGYPAHSFTILVQGSQLGTYTPSSTNFSGLLSLTFQSGGASATLEFVGVGSGSDAAVAIDAIAIIKVSSS